MERRTAKARDWRKNCRRRPAWHVPAGVYGVRIREAAEKLAREVVEAKLSAGAQIIGPVTSAFWHLGEFGTGEEWQLLLKTHSDRFEDLQAYLTEHHPWNNPEIVAVPIVAGSDAYLSWVRKTVESGEES